MVDVNYVLRPFDGKINPGDPMWLKVCLQVTKEIDKETDMLDISGLTTKDVLNNFIS